MLLLSLLFSNPRWRCEKIRPFDVAAAVAVEVGEVEGQEVQRGGPPVISGQSKVLSSARHSLNHTQEHPPPPLATPLDRPAELQSWPWLQPGWLATLPRWYSCVPQPT